MRAIAPAAACLFVVTFSGCGGTAGSTTTTTTSTSTGGEGSSTGATTAASTSGGSASGSSKPGSRPLSGDSHSSESAKGFVTPGADNSIPEYGTESSSRQRMAADAALHGYLMARANGEWSAACSYLAASARRQLDLFAKASKGKLKGCAPVFAALEARARANILRGTIVALRIKGKSAFALFYGPHRQQYTMPMAIEAGAWKVTQLSPPPYPLNSATVSP